jgi:hypothetical protein
VVHGGSDRGRNCERLPVPRGDRGADLSVGTFLRRESARSVSEHFRLAAPARMLPEWEPGTVRLLILA